jgi:DNA-binding NtrC family response regulator
MTDAGASSQRPRATEAVVQAQSSGSTTSRRSRYLQVIIFDPTREIARYAEMILAPAGYEICSVGLLRSLHALLAASPPEDVLIARVSRDEDGVKIAECLHNPRFLGATFLMVDHPDLLGLEQRLRLPRAESHLFSTGAVEEVLNRLATNGPPAPPARMPSRRDRATFHGLVGRSKQMLDVFARIEKAAVGDANVCIWGESGTGKELIARAIHAISDRRNGPLITFDCTAVPEGLAESQLFGHVRGAFTGAIENREGVFSLADKGTLFIDELCELSPPLQAKLLRVIQSREFVKVGGTKPIRTNIRLVTATNKDPKKAADAGTFRADDRGAIVQVVIRVPPLRERREDIPMLVEHFVARYSAAYKKPVRGVERSAVERIIHMPWPGNVRQLENFLAQAVVLVEGDMLTERDLFVEDAPTFTSIPARTLQLEPDLPLREVERRYILRTLQRAQGNRTEAAKLLGISRRALQRKLKAYALGSQEVPGAEAAPLIERFTERAQRVVILAREEAGRFRHDFVGTEHVLLGLLREGEGIATAALQRLGVRPETVKAEVERALAGFPETLTFGGLPFTPQAKRILELSIEEARQLGHKCIDTEHLLLGLMKEGRSIAAKILESLGARLDEVRRETLALHQRPSDDTPPPGTEPPPGTAPSPVRGRPRGGPLLSSALHFEPDQLRGVERRTRGG